MDSISNSATVLCAYDPSTGALVAAAFLTDTGAQCWGQAAGKLPDRCFNTGTYVDGSSPD